MEQSMTLVGLTSIFAIIAQIDAHIPERFKNRWPKWLMISWNLLAGNYKHSMNQPF